MAGWLPVGVVLVAVLATAYRPRIVLSAIYVGACIVVVGAPVPLVLWAFGFSPLPVLGWCFVGALMTTVVMGWLYGRRRLVSDVDLVTDGAAWVEGSLPAAFERLSLSEGLPSIPTLVISAMPGMNAMAWVGGGQSAVIVSDGMWRGASREELMWVLCHELSHLVRRDALSSRMWHAGQRVGRALRGVGLRAMWVFRRVWVLGPLVRAYLALCIRVLRVLDGGSAMIDAWLCRRIELRADRDAALWVGPQGGLSLFERLEGGIEPRSWMSGHPRREKRLRALRRLR